MNERIKPSVYVIVIVSAAYCCGNFGCLLSPVTSDLYAELSGASPFWVNFLVSGAAVFSIFFSFIAAFLSRHISKKKLHVVAVLLFAMGGLGFVFGKGLAEFVLFRCLCCIGSGIVFTTGPGIICELNQDDLVRSKCFGISNITSTIISMLFCLLAGVIASRSQWHNVFYLGLIGVVIAILTAIFVPDNGPEKKKETTAVKHKNVENNNRLLLISLIAGQFAMNMFFGVMYYLTDLYVSETGIGDSLLTGTEMACGMLCGALVSAFFYITYHNCKRWTGPLSWLLTSLPFLALGIKASAVSFLVFGSLSMGMVSLNYLYYQQKISERAPSGLITFYMSINSIVSIAGTTVSAYLPGVVKRVLGVSTMKDVVLVLGICMLVCTVLSLICTIAIREKAKN